MKDSGTQSAEKDTVSTVSVFTGIRTRFPDKFPNSLRRLPKRDSRLPPLRGLLDVEQPPLFFHAAALQSIVRPLFFRLQPICLTISLVSGTQQILKVKATLKVRVVIPPSVLLDSSVILNGLQDVCHPLRRRVCFKRKRKRGSAEWACPAQK